MRTLPLLEVQEDASLVVDDEGRELHLRHRGLALPSPGTDRARAVRGYLASFVGVRVPFTFAADEPADGAAVLSPLGEELLRRGLARYCPRRGVELPGLSALEGEARAAGRGIWGGSADGAPTCPPP